MKKIMPILFVPLLLTAFTGEKKLTKIPDITCVLTSDKAVYKVGELPKFKLEICNNSGHDIYLIGSLDGSDVKGRFPYCYFSIHKPRAARVVLPRCGNMNTLRVEDFKLVKSGHNFDPYESIDDHGFFPDYMTTSKETFKNTGVYKLRFYYSTNARDIEDFIGDKPFRSDNADSSKVRSLLKGVPKIDLISNEIEIRFEK